MIAVATTLRPPPRRPMPVPARHPRRPGTERLLVVDRARGLLADRAAVDIPGVLSPGDLLVVNDAATLPASLHGTGPGGEPIEVRLAAHRTGPRFQAVLFGPGDWRDDTDLRQPPPRLGPGAVLRFGAAGAGLRATIEGIAELSHRLVELRFDREGAALWDALYRIGRPVQYSYLGDAFPLATFQTAFATAPWAFEMPSAARPLTWSLLLELRRRGVAVASVTHAAGLSATGDPRIDRALPLPERYRVPAATVTAVERARKKGGRVIAVGTTALRALEGAAAAHGRLVAAEGVTDLRIGERTELHVADSILTNVHVPGESHFELLCAFTGRALLERAATHAAREGYLSHELGDAVLIL